MKDIAVILERLLSSGLITKEQIVKAQEHSRISGATLDKVLIKDGMVSEEDFANTVADEIGIPFVDLKDYLIDTDTIKLVPEKLARDKNIIPLFRISNTLTVAMGDPEDIITIDELRLKTGFDIETVLATDSAIRSAIEQYYGVTGSMEDVLEAIDKHKLIKLPDNVSAKVLEDLAQEAPIVKFVNLLIMEAVKSRASDIHIEPEEDSLRIRFRIDGFLHEISSPSKNMQAAIISRIKVLSKMDIAEKRKPQDGQLQMRIENRNIDVRVASFPTVYGENVVLRILDKANVILELSQLGFVKEVLATFQELIKQPNGIMLVTGPTGSGKTTTLYAAIQTINSEERNIITLEDPVEYHLPRIRQSQINPKAGVTFAAGLRSILRQDPDVIMVGEIRDLETVDIAVQAALTGHLVFSTLHTNDAAGTISRLLDMGAEPFLVSSSVIGILAQRLVRAVCPKCKEPHKETEDGKEYTYYRSKGCGYCKNTGFHGRLGIFELMVIDDKIRKLISTKASSEEIRKAAQEAGMRTLREDGLARARTGITTLEEVMRVSIEH
ncbi:MAG: type II secretion system protein GspE [Candidatus Omnitrophica bacterium CG12_big_fil_rev_8_21_14_0_65_43_15]|uniref:Type II secretion system protein GspE n=1 Tax=Candidatus Taenaricola geysiri TaxID=1974752 RepID=A0A2J0LPL1_9BACT|nr:MAG: type II secretion system protein GspE [Candidatus Omnitrophica bacterium CG1_02_43_210]PIR65526.1 MAG: type II secretion system protein GspE [Candidatus Omnitrophica bacterium CG10_big_fil_rev_8_21_14_0_10_43_8]PIV12338.1 MAG: type II secretion system protein GspE [Candidatus Omnitrophica bacterium CG03_land_8_20_14_0_80_43_22]PIW66716.1 MAG: type II secretion system protein GspE [Candidatus Omnitrophica bacterium CG12_big_fil_rev_8_21_14_0_65_43_15]PIW80774.1 MAG: type II secretion sys